VSTPVSIETGDVLTLFGARVGGARTHVDASLAEPAGPAAAACRREQCDQHESRRETRRAVDHRA
jgi:hypothetical protein